MFKSTNEEENHQHSYHQSRDFPILHYCKEGEEREEGTGGGRGGEAGQGPGREGGGVGLRGGFGLCLSHLRYSSCLRNPPTIRTYPTIASLQTA